MLRTCGLTGGPGWGLSSWAGNNWSQGGPPGATSRGLSCVCNRRGRWPRGTRCRRRNSGGPSGLLSTVVTSRDGPQHQPQRKASVCLSEHAWAAPGSAWRHTSAHVRRRQGSAHACPALGERRGWAPSVWDTSWRGCVTMCSFDSHATSLTRYSLRYYYVRARKRE